MHITTKASSSFFSFTPCSLLPSTSTFLPIARNKHNTHKYPIKPTQFRHASIAATPDPDPSLPWPSKPITQITPYEIFNQAKNTAYSKPTFYRLVKLYHPDLAAGSSPLSKSLRTERFKLVVAANDILADPVKKAAYDRWGAGWNGLTGIRSAKERSNGRDFHEGGPGGPFGYSGPWKHSPHMNATWEDWESWYRMEREAKEAAAAAAAEAVNRDGTFRNAAGGRVSTNSDVITFVMLFAFVGVLVQLARVDRHKGVYEERRDKQHNELSRELFRLRKETEEMASKDDRVQNFLKMRVIERALAGEIEDLKEQRMQRMLPPGEVCLSADIQEKEV